MQKFKNICKKIADVLEWVIGYSLIICLFVGGLGFIGYVIALCIGGDKATEICTWLYKTFYVWLIRIATFTTLICFLMIYLSGDANWKNPITYWKNKITKKKEKEIDDSSESVENIGVK